MARVAPGSADALLQFAEPLMDEGEEPPSPAPRPERAQSEASIRDRDEALADMTAEEALRVAAEEGIELETSDRLSARERPNALTSRTTAPHLELKLASVAGVI